MLKLVSCVQQERGITCGWVAGCGSLDYFGARLDERRAATDAAITKEVALIFPWVSPELVQLRGEVDRAAVHHRHLADGSLATDAAAADADAAAPAPAAARLRVDVSLQTAQHSGLVAAEHVRCLHACLPALAPIVVVLKALLNRHHLKSAFTGGLSSYALTVMVARFLLHHQAFFAWPGADADGAGERDGDADGDVSVILSCK